LRFASRKTAKQHKTGPEPHEIETTQINASLDMFRLSCEKKSHVGSHLHVILHFFSRLQAAQNPHTSGDNASML